jgi:hypothetical protein
LFQGSGGVGGVLFGPSAEPHPYLVREAGPARHREREQGLLLLTWGHAGKASAWLACMGEQLRREHPSADEGSAASSPLGLAVPSSALARRPRP